MNIENLFHSPMEIQRIEKNIEKSPINFQVYIFAADFLFKSKCQLHLCFRSLFTRRTIKTNKKILRGENVKSICRCFSTMRSQGPYKAVWCFSLMGPFCFVLRCSYYYTLTDIPKSPSTHHKPSTHSQVKVLQLGARICREGGLNTYGGW